MEPIGSILVVERLNCDQHCEAIVFFQSFGRKKAFFSYRNFFSANLPGQNFGDTSVWDSELSGNITRSDSVMCQLHNPLSDDVGEGSAVDKHAAQLIDTAVTWKERKSSSLFFKAETQKSNSKMKHVKKNYISNYITNEAFVYNNCWIITNEAKYDPYIKLKGVFNCYFAL